MRNSVVALSGIAGQGKSSTVKDICRILMQQNPGHTSVPAQVNFNGDINVILTINGITIGIESVGDPNSRLFGSLDNFVSQRCNIIICSCRSSGATKDKVRSLSNHGYEVVFSSPYISGQKPHVQLNQLCAEHHVHIVNEIMQGNL